MKRIETGVQIDKGGRSEVDVDGDTKLVAAAVRSAGVKVLGAYPKQRVVRADVPLAAVTKLAASTSVTHVGVGTSRCSPIPAAVPNRRPSSGSDRCGSARR